MLSEAEGLAGQLEKDQRPLEEITEELYWRALSRGPTGEELAKIGSCLAERGRKREAYEDVLWSLVNAKEFLFR
jgi:hypothetical protein